MLKNRSLISGDHHSILPAIRLGLLLSLSVQNIHAQGLADITSFQLMDVEGFASMRYAFDDKTTTSSGSTTYESRPTLEEEFYISTRSYVYHPNFLNMDVGAGVIFSQQDFESNGGSSSSDENLFNFSANLRFLESKPYPFTLYYNLSHPATSIGMSGRFLQENELYGVNISLREPLVPLMLNLDVSHETNKGEGFDTLVDNSTDQARFYAYKSFSTGNNVQFSHQWKERYARSGNPGVPIQATLITTNTSNLNVNNTFGEKNQLKLNQLLSYMENETSTDTTTFRYSPGLHWTHSEKTRSFYRYNLFDNNYGSIETENQSLNMGLSHKFTEKLLGNADLLTEDNKTTNFEKQRYAANGSLSYKHAIPWGSMTIGGNWQYDYNDQEGDSLVPVADESVTLNGTTAVDLAQENIDINSIRVTNLAKDTTYDEGALADYVITVAGNTTKIARSGVGSAINDGDTVLVSYNYESGGTIAYSSFTQGYQLNLDLFNYYGVYVRYRNVNQNLESGEPTTSLNSSENIAFGAKANVPLVNDWQVGGEVNHEIHNADISSFTRTNYDAYAQTSLPRRSILRFSARHNVIDNESSAEDTDLYGLRIRLTSQPWFRTTLTAEVDYEEDQGGSVLRERLVQQVGMTWQYRQLNLTLTGRHHNETQGTTEREQAQIYLVLRRTF
ncbi:MAG: hypothetical protein OEW89_01540 [Gammaproteobacteria bacterium]|nr:hypothetical protein [Gammaproteobacteria bacterium]